MVILCLIAYSIFTFNITVFKHEYKIKASEICMREIIFFFLFFLEISGNIHFIQLDQ